MKETSTDGAPPFATDLTTWGDRTAIVTGEQRLTYAQLDVLVEARAAELGPARRLVLLAASNTLEFVVTYLGALRGGHAVLLAAAGAPDHLADLTARYDPDVVALDPTRSTALDERRPGTAHELHPELAVLLSTSGSTGSSKLVRLSQENVDSNARSIATYLGLAPDDLAATTLPPQYCYGLSVINSHLAAGAGLLLTSRSVVDRCFWADFDRAGATSFAGVPHTFELLDRSGFGDLARPSLRYVTQAGGRMAPEVVRKYARLGRRDGWDLVVMYGQTEATARIAYLPPALALQRPEAIGVAIPGGELTIEPVDGAAPGAGELTYRGPNVMLGYAEGPADLARGRDVHVLRTGDLARQGGDGLFEVIGRRSRFVKLFGLRVDLDEVERQLRQRGIDALCAGDDAGLAVATTAAVDVTHLAGHTAVELGLPRSSVAAIAVDALPRLTNGKPDHRAVLELARQEPRRRPAGAGVAELFARTLGLDAVADDDTFVSCGGDSLSYVELSVQLERTLGHLPANWHVTPVGALRAQARRPLRRSGTIETNVAVRALAILAVVAHHTGAFVVPGGAHLLLAVAGFNFARFSLDAGRWRRGAARIAVPTVAWLAVVAATSDDFSIAHALLVNGWLGDADRSEYWFTEALLPIVLGFGYLASRRSVARTLARHPFWFPVSVTVAALAVRFDLDPLPDLSYRIFRPHEIAWLFGIGWAAASARTSGQRLVVSGLVAVAVPGFFGRADQEWVVALGLLALVWVAAVPILRPLDRAASMLAAASLYVYLTHWQVFPPLLRTFGAPVAVTGSLLVGIGVAWVVGSGRRFRPWAARTRARNGAASSRSPSFA